MTNEKELREQLAELEHEQWVKWSQNLNNVEKLSPERIERWQKLWIPYSKLTEAEKDQDREWADKVLNLLHSHTKEVVELVKKMRVQPIVGGVLGPQDYDRGFSQGYQSGFRQALDDLLASLEDNKK
jgi:hypothetical protein